MITITAADSPYSFGCNTAVLLIDTSAGNVIVNLPPAQNSLNRGPYRFTKITNDSNTITIQPFSGDTVNQLTSFTFSEKVSVLLTASEKNYWTIAAAVLNPPRVTVKDYGAVGDGVTDDRAAIQAAVDYVYGLGGGTVYFPPGNYRTTSQGGGGAAIVLKSGVCITGERESSIITIVATTTQIRGILTDGNPSSDRAVAGTIAKGSLSFLAAAAGSVTDLVENDWVTFTISDPNYNDTIAFDWAQVKSVSGTTVNVKSSFQQSFVAGTGQTLYFQRMAGLTKNVEISNLHLKLESSGVTTGTVLLSPYWTRGVVIKNNVVVVSPSTLASAFIAMFKCADARVYGNRFILESSTVGSNITGGGVELAESVDVIFDNNILESENSTTNGVLLSVNFGTNRFQITNNHINNAQDFGIITYAHPYNGVIAHNIIGVVKGVGTGISLGGAENVVVEGNILLGSTNGASFGIVSSTDAVPVVPISPLNNLIRNNIVDPNSFTTPYQTTYLDRCDQWQDIPFADLLFSMNVVGGVWTVSSTSVTYFRYVTNGNNRTIDFNIDTTTVSGTAGSGLRVSLPFAYKGRSLNPVWVADSGSLSIATALIDVSSTTMTIRKATVSNWLASTLNTSVQGQITGKF